MTAEIRLRITPNESLTERQLAALVRRAEAAGKTPEQFLSDELDRTIASLAKPLAKPARRKPAKPAA